MAALKLCREIYASARSILGERANLVFQITVVVVELKLSSTQELKEEDINFTLIYLTTNCFL